MECRLGVRRFRLTVKNVELFYVIIVNIDSERKLMGQYHKHELYSHQGNHSGVTRNDVKEGLKGSLCCREFERIPCT